MKKYFVFLFIILATTPWLQAQTISNAKTQEVKIYGNCGMCKKKIEKAAQKAGEASATWDEDTHMAHITYDSTKTNLTAILQRVANAGYDSDDIRSDQAIYDKLHECCHYDRPAPKPTAAPKATVKKKVVKPER